MTKFNEKLANIQEAINQANRLVQDALLDVQRMKPSEETWNLYLSLCPMLPVCDWIIGLDVPGVDDLLDYINDGKGRGAAVYWIEVLEYLEDLAEDEDTLGGAIPNHIQFRKDLIAAIIKTGLSGYCYDW